MYSIKVELLDETHSVIERCMSSNNAVELLPVLLEICRAKYKMVNPVALYMGDNVYRIIDIGKPYYSAMVHIVKHTN